MSSKSRKPKPGPKPCDPIIVKVPSPKCHKNDPCHIPINIKGAKVVTKDKNLEVKGGHVVAKGTTTDIIIQQCDTMDSKHKIIADVIQECPSEVTQVINVKGCHATIDAEQQEINVLVKKGKHHNSKPEFCVVGCKQQEIIVKYDMKVEQPKDTYFQLPCPIVNLTYESCSSSSSEEDVKPKPHTMRFYQ